MGGIGSVASFCICVAIALIVVRITSKTTKSFFAIIVNIGIGAVAMWILDVIGYGLPVNWLTAGLVGLLGLPGVIVAVVLKYVINVL